MILFVDGGGRLGALWLFGGLVGVCLRQSVSWPLGRQFGNLVIWSSWPLGRVVAASWGRWARCT